MSSFENKEYTYWDHHLKKVSSHLKLSSPVNFPFDPYDIQETFVDAATEAIRTGSFAAIESPTGTGKTSCILATIIATELSYSKNLEKQSKSTNSAPSKYIYLARTHSQISQFMREAASWLPFKGVHLASREKSCIHENYENRSEIEKCRYSSSTGNMKLLEYAFSKSKGLADLETLLTAQSVMHKKDCCAHGAARLAVNDDQVRLIAMPYDYIINSEDNSLFQDFIKNSVIFIDEAHNSIKSFNESMSFSIRLTHLAAFLDLADVTFAIYSAVIGYVAASSSIECQDEVIDMLLEQLKGHGLNYPRDFLIESIKTIQSTLSMVLSAEDETSITNVISSVSSSFEQLIIVIKKHFDSFEESNGISFDSNVFCRDIYALCSHVPKMHKDLVTLDFLVTSAAGISGPIYKLTKNKVIRQLCCLVNGLTKYDYSDYALFFSDEEDGHVFNGICLRPLSVVDNIIMNSRSVIMTSGTLFTEKSIEFYLGKAPAINLRLPHVVPNTSLKILSVGKARSGENIEWTYKNREASVNKESLADLIESTKRELPSGGILVAFPSRYAMESSVSYLEGTKSPLRSSLMIEPKDAADISSFMDEYAAKCSNSSPILFFVMKGKLSEGVDFKDNLCRIVIIAGIPFTPSNSNVVIYTRNHLNANPSLKYSFTEWYADDAFLSINQTCGRVIRHIKDWGAVILFDNRFSQNRGKLCPWMLPFYEECSMANLNTSIREVVNNNFSSGNLQEIQSKEKANPSKEALLSILKLYGKDSTALIVESLKSLKSSDIDFARKKLIEFINQICQNKAMRGTPEFIARRKASIALKKLYPLSFWTLIEEL